MDYNLAALKLFCGQLKDAQATSSSPSSLSLGSILFQRAWLQGTSHASAPGGARLHCHSYLRRLLDISTNISHATEIRSVQDGVLVSDSEQGCFLLDDGSGTIELSLSNEFQQQEWKTGMYVMVVGAYIIQTDGPPFIKVHKIVDLSPFPDREAMWHLEVIEAYKLFYGPSLDD